MSPFEYCKNKVVASGSSFYYSFLFLAPQQRDAIMAIYAFCREVDDIVDECNDPQIAAQKLLWWQTEIDRVFTNNAQHPVGIALQQVIPQFALQKIWFSEILQGMQMDLNFQGYATFADLKVYCHCVASTVGMLAASVFGYKNPRTLEYAKNLGIAFQLINIIRDLGEDARRGRIYLPEDELEKFEIAPAEILELKIKDPQKLSALLAKFATLSRSYYNSAVADLSVEDRAAQRSGLIMAKIYFCILHEIERAKFKVLNQKISITPLRKLWIAYTTFRSERKLCLAQ